MHPVLHEALSRSPVMPVLVIPEISMAAPLAEGAGFRWFNRV